MGSPAFTGAVLVAAESPAGAADKIGVKESRSASRQQAAMRKSSRACRSSFRWAGRNRMIFMNYSLPVQRYPNGFDGPDEFELVEVNDKRVCLSVPLGAIQALSKRSRSVNRAPFANSCAEISLRPSSLTERRRNKVAWPQAIKIWESSRKMVPGALTLSARKENGSAQRWQVCPRKEVYAPGQGAKPRMRL